MRDLVLSRKHLAPPQLCAQRQPRLGADGGQHERALRDARHLRTTRAVQDRVRVESHDPGRVGRGVGRRGRAEWRGGRCARTGAAQPRAAGRPACSQRAAPTCPGEEEDGSLQAPEEDARPSKEEVANLGEQVGKRQDRLCVWQPRGAVSVPGRQAKVCAGVGTQRQRTEPER